jgi:putative colanic acid biosynthesis UDP-glucose lipid carrier transferase
VKTGLKLKEHSASIILGLRTLDALCFLLAGLFSFWLRFNHFNVPLQYKNLLMLGVILGAINLASFGTYRIWRGASLSSEIRCVFNAVLSTFALLLLSSFLTHTTDLFSRIWVITWLISSVILLLGYRVVLRQSIGKLRTKGYNIRRVVIIGDSELAQNVAAKLKATPNTGFLVQGFVGETEEPSTSGLSSPYLGSIDNIDELIKHYKVDQVWIALPMEEAATMKKVQSALATSPVTIRFVPDIYGFQLLNHSLTEVAGLPVINLSTSHMLESKNRLLKSIEDKILSSVILIGISPILLFIAIGVKLSSPGPVFYRQERVSWNGHSFNMLKFRSMGVDSEKNGVQWGGATNMSVTKFGAFIRKTSLDELPQFINVLKGDMSIVGPRPERTMFVEQFKHEIPGYMQKHMVKAGITGWAQINGWRGDTDLEKRIECDLYYIEHWSIWLDLKIILLTFWKGFIHKNAA